ncbi:hypothetical protein [Paenibacillus sp. RC67]|uniref:glycine zipper domain-containing protein n=1 Tax=Paenibacillus sp. RC67 TaxID=3039392 RepID=UPI0024AE3EA2|nr:hypothetical protein [Paenibacillus sp. RC67]
MLQGGSLWGGLIAGSLSEINDIKSLSNGQLNKKDFAVKTTGNVTGALGVMAGIEYGAIVGTSIFPGVGTVIGSAVGGIMGNMLGQTIGVKAGNAFVNHPLVNNMTQTVTQPAQEVMTK